VNKTTAHRQQDIPITAKKLKKRTITQRWNAVLSMSSKQFEPHI